MGGTPIPYVPPQFFDDNGAPAAGFSLYSYEAGTTTAQAMYSDVSLAVPHTNPLVLPSSGFATIFLDPTLMYKFVLKDTEGATVWTRDNVAPAALSTSVLTVEGTAGENLSAGEAVYCSDGSGGLTAGQWYLTDADLTYASNLAVVVGFAYEAITSGSEGTIQLAGQVTGLTGLTAGTTYYISATAGEVTSTAPTNSRAVGVADSTTSLIMAPVEGANETTGPLPAIDGSALTGITTYVDSSVTTVGNVGAGEDTLQELDVAADTLTAAGDSVHGWFHGINANNANAKTIRIRLLDDTQNNQALSVSMPANEATEWIVRYSVTYLAAGTAMYQAHLVGGPANTAASVEMMNQSASITLDFSETVHVRITGEATNDDDIQCFGGVVMGNEQ